MAARADFVPQATFVQCVGASIQMMLNMIEPGRDRSASTQRRLQRLARSWSGARPDGTSRQGASVRGWAVTLALEGGGPYRLVGDGHDRRRAGDGRPGDRRDRTTGRTARVARPPRLGDVGLRRDRRPTDRSDRAGDGGDDLRPVVPVRIVDVGTQPAARRIDEPGRGRPAVRAAAHERVAQRRRRRAAQQPRRQVRARAAVCRGSPRTAADACANRAGSDRPPPRTAQPSPGSSARGRR